MKTILIPVIAGLVIGVVGGLGLLYLEFAGVEETFINYLP